MTDRDKIPPRVEVTTKFLADAMARQRTYEAQRRMWTQAFHPAAEPRAQAATRSRRGGRIHDPRQGKLEL